MTRAEHHTELMTLVERHLRQSLNWWHPQSVTLNWWHPQASRWADDTHRASHWTDDTLRASNWTDDTHTASPEIRPDLNCWHSQSITWDKVGPARMTKRHTDLMTLTQRHLTQGSPKQKILTERHSRQSLKWGHTKKASLNCDKVRPTLWQGQA